MEWVKNLFCVNCFFISMELSLVFVVEVFWFDFLVISVVVFCEESVYDLEKVCKFEVYVWGCFVLSNEMLLYRSL